MRYVFPIVCGEPGVERDDFARLIRFEKRTSAAKSRQARRPFTARLNPCPSFASLPQTLKASEYKALEP
jgi:hypothetical protein